MLKVLYWITTDNGPTPEIEMMGEMKFRLLSRT